MLSRNVLADTADDLAVLTEAPSGDEPIVVRPDPAELKLTGATPEIRQPKPDELVAQGRERRFAFVIVGVVAAGIVMLAAGPGNHGVSIAGLMLDIAGAALLTTGLMLPDWAIGEMAGTFYGENRSIRAYWVQTRADAYVAVGLLVAGFALQALGSL